MTFSKEDKAAWLDSEVMRELERYAEDVLNGPPVEAFQGIKTNAEEKVWEEEDLEDKLVTAVDEFNEPTATATFEQEIHIAYNKNLFTNLEKVAHSLSNIKAIYRIERSLKELKVLLREV